MARRKGRTRRGSKAKPVVLVWKDPPQGGLATGWRGLLKAILTCGAAGGLVGASVGAALAAEESALPAAMIVGVPMAIVGALVLGWSVRLFGAVNRLRHGALVGGALGMLGAGTLGAVAGLSIWAFTWSLTGAILGALIQSLVTTRGRRPYGLIPGVLAGVLIGILVRAIRVGPVGVMTEASRGGIIGALLGVLLIPALLAWLSELPGLLRRRRRRSVG